MVMEAVDELRKRRTQGAPRRFGSILVPLDGSILAERALEDATSLALSTAASLVLVRAVPSISLADIDERVARARALATAEAYLREPAASLRARGLACETATPVGNPAHCIVRQAELRRVDLIAMATHGRTGPKRWLLGSVAESVVAHSPVPVLLERAWQPVRPEPLLASSRPRLLVPLDGSRFAETALDPAVGLASDVGAELILLRVEPVATDVVHDDFGRVVTHLDELDERSRAIASEYLESVAERLARQWPGLSVDVHVRLGDPAAVIDQTVARTGATLVVMATHGRAGLRRSIMGSIAGEVLERGSAPLVLVRPRVPASQGAPAESARSVWMADFWRTNPGPLL